MNEKTEQNYLKNIFKLSQIHGKDVFTNFIAEAMQIKAASVSEALQKLSDKKLIIYTKYKPVSLTQTGLKIAVEVVRRHRLWEFFLCEKLQYKWDEVHGLAEELEHIYQGDFTDRLAFFLGNPETDPHGDPIPDKNGKFKPDSSIKLSNLDKNIEMIFTGIINHSTIFLHYLDKIKLKLGNRITIWEINEFDKSMIISINNSNNIFNISKEVGNNILVREK